MGAALGPHGGDIDIDRLVQAVAVFAPSGAALSHFDVAQAQTLRPVPAANWR